MGTSLADELFRVFRIVSPDVIGRKKTRRLMERMLVQLSTEIPDNGCGPVVGLRREAQQFLINGMREIEATREHA